VSLYIAEEFTDEESNVLRRYFTNLDGPVFALVNLPEVVKGALFARYSRSSKSLRRLFLDEFVGDLDMAGDLTLDATVGLDRAEQLYQKVFVEYGDDSVAQLGAVHLACEQASNVLTKVLEWGRLMSYLEQSTRYIAYDERIGGRYRYHRPPTLLASSHGTRYVADMDRLFDAYAEMTQIVGDHLRSMTPKDPGDSDFVYRQAIAAKALDATRGILPAAALSNVGIHGSGQAFEALLLRMASHPLPEARDYQRLMLEELRKVIPSFLSRVDRPDRGGVWSEYLARTRDETADVVERLGLAAPAPPDAGPKVRLVDFDPEGELKVIAAMAYASTHVPEHLMLERVRALGQDERRSIVNAYVGDRVNRRHRPGRAFERTDYRFDVLADYGAFRDLQRHRLMTIEWQALSPAHGAVRPPLVDEAGQADAFDEAMERSSELFADLFESHPAEAAYSVCLAYRLRFVMQMNARQAMHVIELRSTPQGHPAYRQVAHEMHRLIAEEAGHHLIAEAMSHVDHASEAQLERLESERRAEQRRGV